MNRALQALAAASGALLIAVAASQPHTPSIPPCEYEDSWGCYWDGGNFGNGEGLSFVVDEDGNYTYYPDGLPADLNLQQP